MKKRCSIRILGKVQGVWFRKCTKEKADELGVAGFVRNEADGSVYIEAEAESPALDDFVAWCHIGSARAQVKQVIVHEQHSKADSGFTIHY